MAKKQKKQKLKKKINWRHFWSIFFICLAYFFTYAMPIILLYFSLRDSFVVTYITKAKISLAFIGFVTISAMLSLILFIKLSRKLRNAKASVFKSITLGLMGILVVLFIVFLLIKVDNFTYVLEQDISNVLTKFRGFLATCRKYLIIFSSCLSLATLSNITALIIDKEYVKSLNWL